MKERYVIEVERPAGVTKAQMKHYIKTAVWNWSGGGDPEDPLFYIAEPKVLPYPTRQGQDARRYHAIRSTRVGARDHVEIWNVAYSGSQLDEAVDACIA